MKNKNLQQFLMFNKHDEVIDKVYTGITDGQFTIHEGKKFTIIAPADMKWGDKTDLMPAIVAHTDTVSSKKPTTFKVNKGVVTNPDGVLGADDRAGCYAIWKMLNANVRAIYILTDEEETGGIGAYECSVSDTFTTLLPNVSALIELDRESNKDIALYGYDNADLVTLFETFGYVSAYGSYTDVVDLSQSSGIACINLSVGYYNQHTKYESLVLQELYDTVDVMVHKLPKELYTKVYADEGDVLPAKWGSAKYTTDSGNEPIECDVCGQHEPLYSTFGGDICKHCLDYEDTWYSFRDADEPAAMPF
jgi:hypothetical protein